ncbi:hypothetical protein [Butyricimonas paravirosa]|uniref:hypothetical protein n=1 Tax=Butyricimonas paravirosa TaxID=1472417 RepID=UPI002108B8A7|nr:hypothetical protein [Butyricimonas paravirosa]MCQ4875674.1 hypothetical protein [Butyricimonas paravirosa]
MKRFLKIGCLGVFIAFAMIYLLAKTGTRVLGRIILFVLISRVLLRLLRFVLHVIVISILILLMLNVLI